MADKNTYALSVSLDLDASAAFDTLNDFTTKVTSLEDQVSTAAQNAIKSIDKISQTLDVSLSSVVTKVDELNSSVADISRGFSEVNSIVTEIEGIDTELLEHFKELNQDLEERLKIEEKIKNIVLEQQETNEIFLKTINDITDAIKSKNLQHEAQTRHLENENVVADAVANQIGRQHRNTISLTQALNQVISRFKQILSIISGFDKETEQFVTANYRAYNSQTVLLNQARGLSAEYGIFEEHAISAMKELMQVKAPREELVKLAQVIGYAQRVTGVSAKTWADYTRSLKLAGQAQEQITRNITMTMEAQRKYAITTAELERMHDNLSKSNAEMILYYGKDAPEAFKLMALGYTALEKQTASAAGTGEKFLKLQQLTGIEMIKLKGALRIPQNATQEQLYNALIPSMRKYIAQANPTIKAAIQTGKALGPGMAAQLKETARAYSQIIGQDIDADMLLMAIRAENLTDATGKELLQFEKLGDALKALKTPADYAAEANQAFTGASKELWATLKGLAGILLSLAAEVLIPVIKALSWVFQIVGKVINMWYNMTLALGPFGTVLRWVVGIIVIAVLALITFIPVLTALAGLFFGLPGVVTWVASSITALAAAVGGAIVTILTSIGTGLAALGSAIQPVIGPILGLALALLLVSVAAVAFAYAVKIIAEVGWAAVPAMLGLIVAIGLLGLVLIGLAYLAMPVIPALLAIGAAILMVGVAALAVGYTIKLIAEAFSILVSSLEILSAGVMINFADALLASSWKISLAIIILLPALALLPLVSLLLLTSGVILAVAGALFAVAAMWIGIGAVVLGYGMKAIAEGGKVFQGVNFISIASQLLIGGLLLLAAGVPFIIGATLVGIGALLLGVGLRSLGPGASTLKDINFIAIASQLMVGGLLLLAAGMPFIIGATLVGIGALLLGSGLRSLGPGAKALSDINFISIAGQLLVGGLLLLAAGGPFVIGATLVGIGALLLGFGLLMLGTGAKTLKDIDFAAMAMQLMVGGIWLAIGAEFFIIGATAVGLAAIILGIGLLTLGAGAALLSKTDFKALGENLIAGSYYLLGASVNLLGAAAVLLLVNPILSIGLIGLIVNGLLFIAVSATLALGSSLFANAMESLQRSFKILVSISDRLLTNSWMISTSIIKYLLPAALAMLIIGPLFLIGATLFLMSIGVLTLVGAAMASVGLILIASGALFAAGMWLLRSGIDLLIEVIEPFKKAVTDLLAVTGMLLPASTAILLSGIYVFVGAILLGAGSAVLGVSVAALAVVAAGMWLASIAIGKGASKLEAATEPLFNAGQYVCAAGESIENGIIKLSAAANNIRSIISDFFIAASMMSAVAPALISGAIALITGSMALGMASVYVIIGAYMIMRAIPLMSIAINMLAKIGDSFKRAIETFKQPSVELLQTLGSITLAITSLNAATTSLQAQATQFQQTFGGITTSISSFTSSLQAPVEQLTTIMGQMAGVLTSFGPIGETLEADLDNLITIVDSYAAKLEGVSERIQTAVATKAIPAMRAAEEAGIEEAIKAESISTIEMIPPDKDDSTDKTNELLQRQLEVLSKLADGVEKIGAGSGTEIAQILEMLQTFLPEMVSKEEGLSTQMNDWMR